MRTTFKFFFLNHKHKGNPQNIKLPGLILWPKFQGPQGGLYNWGWALYLNENHHDFVGETSKVSNFFFGGRYTIKIHPIYNGQGPGTGRSLSHLPRRWELRSVGAPRSVNPFLQHPYPLSPIL